MLLSKRIFVVVPAYRARETISGVIAGIPKFVDKILVVDDACPMETGKYATEHLTDKRVEVLFNEENLGVGGAMKTGYQHCLKLGAEIVFKLDADGQMDPLKMEIFVKCLLSRKADYVKGNRFYFPEYTSGMPKLRLAGNLGLSFLTKLSSGYWDILDPTNGYTAITAETLKVIELEKVDNRYFFESDLLFRLHIADARVVDVPCQAIYQGQISSLSPLKEIRNFASKNLRNFFKRIIYEYFVRDFSIASIYLLLGVVTGVFAISLGSWHLYDSHSTGVPKPAGTVVFVAMLGVFAFQFLISFLNFDITTNNNTKGISELI